MFSKFPVKTFKILSRFNQTSAIAANVASNSLKLEVEPPNPVETVLPPVHLKKYRVEIARPADTNRILNFLEKNYLCDDPLCKSLNLCTKLNESLEVYVKSMLSHGMSLVAKENSKENQVIGVCVNQKNCVWNGDHLDDLAKITTDLDTKKLLRIWALISREPAMHDLLQQLNIFELAFISARKDHPELATELTNHSLNLARDMSFNFARIDSKDDETTKIAENFAMEKLWEVPYKNILSDVDETPVVFPEHPNAIASVFYINLKMMPPNIDKKERKLAPVFDLR